MSRRAKNYKRKIKPDYLFKDERVSKNINRMMWDGKKTVAQKIVYQVIHEIGLDMFLKALENVQPTIEIKSRRVGGATYQVPMAIRPERSSYLSHHALIKAARARSEKTMVERYKAECLDAIEGKGGAFKRKIEIQRTAASNQAFAHYSWN